MKLNQTITRSALVALATLGMGLTVQAQTQESSTPTKKVVAKKKSTQTSQKAKQSMAKAPAKAQAAAQPQVAQSKSTSSNQALVAQNSQPVVAMIPKTETSATSTTQAAPAPASSPLGRFGVTLLADVNIDAEAMPRLGASDIGKSGMKAISTNYLALSYKLDDKSKVGVRQYWDKSFGPSASESDNKTTWLAATISTKTKGILGSDDLAPSLMYYIPTTYNVALRNGLGDDQVRHNGILRLDLEIPWTLTPKWTASIYLNPRQSFIPNDEYKYSTDEKGRTFVSDVALTTTTLINYAYLYYNASDSFQPYAFVGFRNRFATNEAFSNYENTGLPGIGFNFVAGKNFTLSAEVNQEVALASSTYLRDDVLVETNVEKDGVVVGKKTEIGTYGDKPTKRVTTHNDATWLDSHDLNYELVLSISI